LINARIRRLGEVKEEYDADAPTPPIVTSPSSRSRHRVRKKNSMYDEATVTAYSSSTTLPSTVSRPVTLRSADTSDREKIASRTSADHPGAGRRKGVIGGIAGVHHAVRHAAHMRVGFAPSHGTRAAISGRARTRFGRNPLWNGVLRDAYTVPLRGGARKRSCVCTSTEGRTARYDG